PACLVLYEQSEYALYTIDQELRSLVTSNVTSNVISNTEYQDTEIVSIIGSVANEKKLINIFEKYHIKTIYHAAAYKHVPIVESNPFEGTINNTKGTYHCACAAIKAHVDTFVLISTDKAVRPTNVMGASKRLAELVCQGLSQSNSHTCFS
ncbi:polysaccharide biosynthesis protein, partial [Pseudoalteromonas sp. SIMBA_153]